jgi:TolB-like protein/DNA-binding winged helix-turn-helix (wHTH) protein/Tfp pilus assembly protein PilF
MGGPASVNRVFRFGPFELNLASGELRKSGITLKLRPQAAKVLVLLATQPGKMVTREQLREQIWGSGLFVDFEHGLNLCIQQIRAALDDDADKPRYVETVPRHGYRFIARVEERVSDPGASQQIAGTDRGLVGRPQKTASWWRRPWAIGGLAVTAALIVVALFVGLAWRFEWFRPVLRNGQIRSIAVLPLMNLSGDPEQEYFADGMTEQLTTDLGQISALRVISRTSAMHYKGTTKKLPEIARELNADAVVEGAVTRAANRVRITAQLIEAPTDRHLWAKTYERDLRDVVSLQDDVAQAIAGEIRVKLTPQERIHLASARPVNPQAHEAYLRGLQELRTQTREGVEKAIPYFQQAIALDSNDALAYAGLADAYHDQSTFFRAPLEVMPKAKAAAARAIELDDTLAEAHASLGLVRLEFDWDWPGAEREFRRALELSPNDMRALSGYADYFITLNRTDEAIENLRRAQAVDPFVSSLQIGLPQMLFFARRYLQAIEAARQLNDDRFLALSYAELGHKQEAIAAADRAIKTAGSPVVVAQLASVYAKAGKTEKARAMLDALEAQVRQRYVCGFHVACVYSALGDKEKAFAWLEKAYLARSD